MIAKFLTGTSPFCPVGTLPTPRHQPAIERLSGHAAIDDCNGECLPYDNDMHVPQPQSLQMFNRIEIINLPHRADRRRAVKSELLALGQNVDGIHTLFLPASRPTDSAGFDTIGTHGCFLSHLTALRKARQDGVKSLLILEDDVAFSLSEKGRLPNVIKALHTVSWDVFYGGSPVDGTASPLSKLSPETPAMLAHFIAFSERAIDLAVPYLEAILERPAGSPEGGPMHVDGAYCWLRRANPELATFAATPGIAHQRSSATDIHVRRGIDRVPILRGLLQPARAFKNWRRSKS